MEWNSRRLTAIIENALQEDRATRDATSTRALTQTSAPSRPFLPSRIAFSQALAAWLAFLMFMPHSMGGHAHYEVTVHGEVFDGVRLKKGQQVAVIRHNARVILSCERVILNFLQRMSGTATLTRKFVDAVSGTKARILDTRKTVPGLRAIDKYARTLRGRPKPPPRSL